MLRVLGVCGLYEVPKMHEVRREGACRIKLGLKLKR
jgi:hypothetical protein